MKLLFDRSLLTLFSPVTYAGISSFVHDKSIRSTYDTFDIVKPTVYISDLSNVTKSVLNCISERPDIKVAFIKNENSDQVLENLDNIKSHFGNAYPVLENLYYYDLIACKNAKKKYSYMDLLIINSENDKQVNLNLPLKYIVRIFNNKNMIHNNYFCGTISDSQIEHMYKSSKITLVNNQSRLNAIHCDSYPVESLDYEYLKHLLESDLTEEISSLKNETSEMTNFNAVVSVLKSVNELEYADVVRNKAKELE